MRELNLIMKDLSSSGSIDQGYNLLLEELVQNLKESKDLTDSINRIMDLNIDVFYNLLDFCNSKDQELCSRIAKILVSENEIDSVLLDFVDRNISLTILTEILTLEDFENLNEVIKLMLLMELLASKNFESLNKFYRTLSDEEKVLFISKALEAKLFSEVKEASNFGLEIDFAQIFKNAVLSESCTVSDFSIIMLDDDSLKSICEELQTEDLAENFRSYSDYDRVLKIKELFKNLISKGWSFNEISEFYQDEFSTPQIWIASKGKNLQQTLSESQIPSEISRVIETASSTFYSTLKMTEFHKQEFLASISNLSPEERKQGTETSPEIITKIMKFIINSEKESMKFTRDFN